MKLLVSRIPFSQAYRVCEGLDHFIKFRVGLLENRVLYRPRGRGLMLGVQIRASEPERGDADGRLAYAIKMRCFENGLIIETGGRHSAVLRFLPPLVITDDEIERVGSLFTSALFGSAA